MNDTLHQQLINDLLVESFEGLDSFDRELLTLESGTGGADTLNSIFRTIHTIKGTSGCLGLSKIERTAHVGESLLDLVRNKRLSVHPGMISELLKLSDTLRELLRHIESDGTEGDADTGPLIARLQALQTAPTQPAASAAKPTSAPAPTAQPEPAGFGLFEEEVLPPPSANSSTARTASEPNDESAGFGLFEDEPATPSAAEKTQPTPIAKAAPISTDPQPTAAKSAPAAPTNQPSVADSAIRVDVSQLDRLMNLVGELVLARNQIVQNTTATKDETLAAAAQRLNSITTELQEGVMKTRMLPIGNVWAKFPRIVRDVASELGKKVRLEMEGKETELDRTIIEAIKDPLTHIVRNSIDHGIEKPEKRAERGKPDEGLLFMRAFHEGGQVNIEIADDGAGLNVARIKAKAIEKKLITPEQAARMSDREVFGIIFLPGFSTAEKITNVSGRGVGMDVVKTNIEKIGGSVDVQSTEGHGAVFKIKIPLTLAIIPALIVRSAGDRFAIPQLNLVELMRLDGEASKSSLETVYGAPVFRLRGQLLPLVFLHRELKLTSLRTADQALNIVVLQADQRQFGLVVDEVCDTEEIVVKPLGKHLKNLPMFAGATIMGDGSVALILDVLGLAQSAHLLGEQRQKAASAEKSSEVRYTHTHQLLLFSLPGRNRLALHLDQAARLEEFQTKQIEHSGTREAIQYRGAILPLVHLSQYLPGKVASTTTATERDSIHVIVYQHESASQPVGLVVEEIRDIIDENLQIQPGSAVPGVIGSAVIQGKITDLVDVPSILREAGIS